MQMAARFDGWRGCGSVGGMNTAGCKPIDRFRSNERLVLFFGESRPSIAPPPDEIYDIRLRREGGSQERGNIYPTPKEKKRGEHTNSTRVKEKRAS